MTRWIKRIIILLLMLGLIAGPSLVLAATGDNGSRLKDMTLVRSRQAGARPATVQRTERQEFITAHRQLINELNQQQVEIRSLNQAIRKQNQQTQVRLQRARRSQTRLTAGQTRSLREHLARIQQEKQQLSSDQGKIKVALGDYRKAWQAKDPDAVIKSLEQTRQIQARRLQSLRLIRQELQAIDDQLPAGE